MRQILLITIFSVCTLGTVQSQTKSKAKQSVQKHRDADGIDGRMKGPNGETVYIGAKGGRYYNNAAGNKVYLPYGKGKKKK